MRETPTQLTRKMEKTLARMKPRLVDDFRGAPEQTRIEFETRLDAHFPDLFSLYYELYAEQYDFYYHLEDLLHRLISMWMARSEALKKLDRQREVEPDWFQSQQVLGGVCYVDLFAGNLQDIKDKIPYFKELGLTYLHLMPLFRSPEGENDGGYAVSDYRQVNPALGDMEELSSLAGELRTQGISLVLDLVFNHTSDEHTWALQAMQGDEDFQDYYRMFPDRAMPDAYEANMREIFPDEHPGAFIYKPEIKRWVWATFHSYQWDLNYANPAVFNSMAEEMLFLANAGVEILRLDAVAFIWKQLGTGSENLPGAHKLIQAFNAVARIAAPCLLFKSEAIVHPDDVVKYIDEKECQLSYNPLLMSLLWNTLATREVNLLAQGLQDRFKISPACAWVNYVRCHDDIGWTFSDEDALNLGINGYDHRRFLNAFYTGRFPGSFARGLPFQENPKTGDARISGTCASLAGLEKALEVETERQVELAIRRILLIHAVILTVGGIPLIYLGDEWGTLNDYSYLQDPAKAHDSRWVHRPCADWDRAKNRTDAASVEGRVFQGCSRLIGLRKTNPCFSGHEIQVIPTDNPHVLGYIRSCASQRVLVLANFSEAKQTISANVLRLSGMSGTCQDLESAKRLPVKDLQLAPYQFLCLSA